MGGGGGAGAHKMALSFVWCTYKSIFCVIGDGCLAVHAFSVYNGAESEHKPLVARVRFLVVKKRNVSKARL